MAEYRILVFGKEGCSKCKVLNKRIDKILEKPEWSGFEKNYYDLNTIEGLVNFGSSECLQTQSIPSFLVCRINEDGKHKKIRQTFKEGFDEKTGKFRIPVFVGIQTDYKRGGVITPSDIEETFTEALRS